MARIYKTDSYAFLSGAKAAVFIGDTRDMVGDSNTLTDPVDLPDGSGCVKFVYRGHDNRLPVRVMEHVFENVTVGANIEFNSKMAYGDGIMVVKKVRGEDGRLKVEEVLRSY